MKTADWAVQFAKRRKLEQHAAVDAHKTSATNKADALVSLGQQAAAAGWRQQRTQAHTTSNKSGLQSDVDLPDAVAPGTLAALDKERNERIARELALLKARLQRTSSNSNGDPNLYKVFDRQADAFAELDVLTLTACPRPAASPFKVFSIECGKAGKRKFIVAHRDAFWRTYTATQPDGRHFYEICREDTPCHLYFDVEYKMVPIEEGEEEVSGAGGGDASPEAAVKGTDSPRNAPSSHAARVTNANVDGDRLVAVLLHRVARALHFRFGVTVCRGDVVHLESSTADKFSRHLILRLSEEEQEAGKQTEDGQQHDHTENGITGGSSSGHAQPSHRLRRRPVMFRDVSHAGAFVMALVAQLQTDRHIDAEVDALWVETTKQQVGGSSSSLAAASSSQAAFNPQSAAIPGGLPDDMRASVNEGAAASSSPQRPNGDVRPPLRREFVADLAVYTRNRSMRMYLSRKRGKATPLMPAAANWHLVPPAGSGRGGNDSGDGDDPLSLDYWLDACGCAAGTATTESALLAAASSASPSAPAGSLDTVTAAPTTDGGGPLLDNKPKRTVQVGSAAWERQMWEASLITDWLPPLWMSRRIVGEGTRGGDGGGGRPALSPPTISSAAQAASSSASAVRATLSSEYEHSREHASYRPESHPITGARFLYVNNGAPTAEAAGTSNDRGANTAGEALYKPLPSPSSQQPAQLRILSGGSSPPPFPALARWIAHIAAGPLPVASEDGRGANVVPSFAPAAPSSSSAAAAGAAASSHVRGWSAGVRDIVITIPSAARPPAESFEAGSNTCSSDISSGAAAESDGSEAAASVTSSATVRSVQVLAWVNYEIGGSRWCNRIGRQHKSNHVAYRVDLEGGSAWQTCWDGDCRAARYRSPCIPIPSDLLPDQLPPGAVVIAATGITSTPSFIPSSSLPSSPSPTLASSIEAHRNLVAAAAGSSSSAGTPAGNNEWSAGNSGGGGGGFSDDEIASMDLSAFEK